MSRLLTGRLSRKRAESASARGQRQAWETAVYGPFVATLREIRALPEVRR